MTMKTRRLAPFFLLSLPLLAAGCAETAEPLPTETSTISETLYVNAEGEVVSDAAVTLSTAALPTDAITLGAVPTEHLLSVADSRPVMVESDTVAPPLVEVARLPRDVEFGAVGMMVVQRDGQIVVDRVMPGMPAEAAGMTDGTRVLEVDGMATEDMSLQQFVALVRGEEGSEVTLTVETANGTVEHALVRETLATTETRCDRVRQVRNETEFGGVGIQMGAVETGMRVNGVIDGMPATEAGVLEGDVIVAVDGMALAGAPMVDVVAAIRGEVGVPVALDLLGADGAQRTVTLSRSLMVLPEGGMCAGR